MPPAPITVSGTHVLNKYKLEIHILIKQPLIILLLSAQECSSCRIYGTFLIKKIETNITMVFKEKES